MRTRSLRWARRGSRRKPGASAPIIWSASTREGIVAMKQRASSPDSFPDARSTSACRRLPRAGSSIPECAVCLRHELQPRVFHGGIAPMVLSIACTQMRVTPSRRSSERLRPLPKALCAANASAGSKGMDADLVILEVSSVDRGFRKWGAARCERSSSGEGWCMKVLEADLTWHRGRFESGVQVEVVDDGTIGRVGPGAIERSREARKARRLLPGFVNAHSHAFQRGLRGKAESFEADVLELAGGDVSARSVARRGAISKALDARVPRDARRRDHDRRRVPLPPSPRREPRIRARPGRGRGGAGGGNPSRSFSTSAT